MIVFVWTGILFATESNPDLMRLSMFISNCSCIEGDFHLSLAVSSRLASIMVNSTSAFDHFVRQVDLLTLDGKGVGSSVRHVGTSGGSLRVTWHRKLQDRTSALHSLLLRRASTSLCHAAYATTNPRRRVLYISALVMHRLFTDKLSCRGSHDEGR